MANAKKSRTPWVVAGIAITIVALYSVYRMSGIREVVFKYQQLELKVVATEIKEDERRYQESLKTRPASHLETLVGGVERGMRAKQFLLSTDLYLAEATLASTGEALAQRLLRPRPLADVVQSYAQDRTSELAPLRRIAEGIGEQRRLVDRLALTNVAAALRLAKDAAAEPAGAEAVIKVIHGIASDQSLTANGSAYNFLGNLAFALNRRELAFRYLYQAYVNDPQHLPTLDSLSFALWKLNGDCQSSLSYAVEGYQKGWNQLNAFKSREKEILGLLASVKAAWPSLAQAAENRSSEVSGYFSKHGRDIVSYLSGQYDSLRNSAVYCMAFERVQETEARRIADELLDSDPGDPDYMDTKGFVLMRFQKNENEIRQAVQLFEKARGAARHAHQRELADHHLALAGKLKMAGGTSRKEH